MLQKKKNELKAFLFSCDDILFTLPLFIPDDFDGHKLFGLVVKRFYDLSKTSFPNDVKNFIPIMDMVARHTNITTILIVVPLWEDDTNAN